jgi:two-component system, NtrC family, response regulator AtoC
MFLVYDSRGFTMARILIVDDEEGIRSFLAEVLEDEGHHIEQAENGQEALSLLNRIGFDLVVTDLKMPVLDGMAVLRFLKTEQPEIPALVLTAHGSVESAVDAMKIGAFDYLQKPLQSPQEFRLVAARALEHSALLRIKAQREHQEEKQPPLSYGSSVMEQVIENLQKVAKTQATVMLMGESGTGKEVAARTLHRWSARAQGPFVAVNCGAISANLFESELFGHEKGAFTGALQQRRGRLELAQGGTFFLDEVGELSLDLQTKLLRVLQEKKYERVGGNRTLVADVRWVTATNRNLEQMVKEGQFREDLYHRLAVFPIRMPSLRERAEEIVPIAKFLLMNIGAELGRPHLQLDPASEEQLSQAPWHGNIRELRNLLERSAILSEGPTVVPMLSGLAGSATMEKQELPVHLTELEKDAIIRALSETSGNRRKAAELLGIGLRTLYEKLKRYNVR